MNIQAIISQLQKEYPGKFIIQNHPTDPTEIICEIEPTSEHSDYSTAIAVIDRSIPHYHLKTTETYEIIRGQLKLTVADEEHTLKEGGSFTIHPGQRHFAEGNETWVRVTSHPGWTKEDHYLVN